MCRAGVGELAGAFGFLANSLPGLKLTRSIGYSDLSKSASFGEPEPGVRGRKPSEISRARTIEGELAIVSIKGARLRAVRPSSKTSVTCHDHRAGQSARRVDRTLRISRRVVVVVPALAWSFFACLSVGARFAVAANAVWPFSPVSEGLLVVVVIAFFLYCVPIIVLVGLMLAIAFVRAIAEIPRNVHGSFRSPLRKPDCGLFDPGLDVADK